MQRRHGRKIGWLPLAFALIAPAIGVGAVLFENDYEQEPINYLATPPQDAVAELQGKLERGEAKLKYDSKRGYLLSLLQLLHVPLSSQMLVFSKTGFDRERISPQTPRALYFNDRVYVGWTQGGDDIEVASVDPQLGAVFYLLPQTPTTAPKFVRQTHQCLQCHDTNLAGNIPGFLMRSVFANRQGLPILSAGTYLTSDQSSLAERWGGWYVTGRAGYQKQMGNVVVENEAVPEHTAWGRGANITDLSNYLDTSPYLSPHSDMIALMVGHQTLAQNRLTFANFETRRALHYEQTLNKDLKRPADTHSDSVASRIQSACEPLVKTLLFAGEAKLSEPISGTSDFAARFATYGPRDRQNRSLREFDLKSRLFRYPCSYQVYSAAFNGLPKPAKDYVYRRFEEILTGKDTSQDFARLSATDRRAILEILRDTKPDFAEWEAQQR